MRAIYVALYTFITALKINSYTIIPDSVIPDKFDNCEAWAKDDQECINNPRFMWGSCLKSCMKSAVDVENQCDEWANEGECTNNPQYIHLHCPHSCGMAIAWNPWVRRQLGIDQTSFYQNLYDEKCKSPKDILSAAEMMKTRLINYFGGGYSSVQGFTDQAPSEYLGMMGIAEAFLYTFRLYEIILQTSSNQQVILLNRGHINRITTVLSQGYDADPIMRELTTWLNHLLESSKLAYQFVFKTEDVTDLMRNEFDCEDKENINGPEMIQIIPTVDKFISSSTIVNQLGNPVDSVSAYYTLSNGVKMPVLGLGTWQLEGKECYDAVYEAIKIGYRSIDSAEAYRNEDVVGDAIQASIRDGVVTRQDLFIATKLSDPSNAGYENAKKLIHNQLLKLKVTYIDLYMLHSPIDDRDNLQSETWQALEDLYHEGILKSIGVSNFDSRELKNLVSRSAIKPMVVQNKFDVYHVGKQLDNQGDQLVRYARSENIIVVAYSPFSAYPFAMRPLEDPIIKYIASNHPSVYIDTTGKLTQSTVAVTPAQILLRWALQKGAALIPRSSNIERLKENFLVLTMASLTIEEMKLIDSLQYLVFSPVSKPVPI
eukprot:gene5727-7910_t